MFSLAPQAVFKLSDLIIAMKRMEVKMQINMTGRWSEIKILFFKGFSGERRGVSVEAGGSLRAARPGSGEDLARAQQQGERTKLRLGEVGKSDYFLEEVNKGIEL